MKKAVFSFILFIFVVVFYLFWTDFSLIKKLVGYNVPAPTDFPAVSLNGGLDFLNVPEGFKISIAAKGLSNPRVILFDSKGRMLVSETKAGQVSVLEDPSFAKTSEGAVKNGEFENKRVLIEGLKSPHGLDFYKDPQSGVTYLYIAETHQVARYPYDVGSGRLTSSAGKNIAVLPADGGHFTRTIAFGPNYRTSQIIIEGIRQVDTLGSDKLYISVGSSCDVCLEETWKRAAILESDPKGSFTAEFAGGLRNAVFFVFHPETNEIWATEMGRDNLGDDLPPDEINIVKVAGLEDKFGAKRYGWPFCYGNKTRDITFSFDGADRPDMPRDCSQTDSPAIEVPAHSAPLGLAFITEKKWPAEWQNDLLVAFHGSWNRSEPAGYKIVKFKVDKNGKVNGVEDFISGWLNNDGKTFGRPVDLKFGPGGALYISDDAAGLIYRVNPKN